MSKAPPQSREFVTLKRAQAAIGLNWAASLAYGCCWVIFIEFDTCILSNGSLIDRCQMRPLDIGRAVMSVTEGFFLLALPLAASVIFLVQTSAPNFIQSPKRQVMPPIYLGSSQNAVVSSGYLMHQRFASPPTAAAAQNTRPKIPANSDKPYNVKTSSPKFRQLFKL